MWQPNWSETQWVHQLQGQIENETIKKECFHETLQVATIEPEIEIQLGDMEIEFKATNDTLEQPDRSRWG